MKLADATIYNDNDLTIPTTKNSIISARKRLDYTTASFYVLVNLSYEIPKTPLRWRSGVGDILDLDDLLDIVIVYRAPADGSTGPEMIEELHEKEFEEILSNFEEFLNKTSKRVVNKVLDITRAVLEVE